MRKIGLALALLVLANITKVHAKQKICINEAIAQAGSKISKHYA